MSVFGSLGREHKWQQFIREDYGFAMSYPLGWAVHIPVVGVTGTEFILAPDQVPSVYDAVLGREVLNPFVNIVISEWSDPTENIVDTFAEQRPRGYEGYRFSRTHHCHVRSARHVMAYEFQFGSGTNSFTAMSLLVQKEARLFVITAQNTTAGFGNHRDTLQSIVFSFRLL